MRILFKELAGLRDVLLRVLALVPTVHGDLLLLEVLVDREEMGDLVTELLGQVLELLLVVPARVLQWHREHLVVDPLVLLHAEERDRLHVDHAARERGLGDADHHVEGVAVEGERLRDEPVIRGVHDGREQEAVEHETLALVVPLVLVPAPLRDLDDAGEFVRGHAARKGTLRGPCDRSPPSQVSASPSYSPPRRSPRTTARGFTGRPTTRSSPSSPSGWWWASL